MTQYEREVQALSLGYYANDAIIDGKNQYYLEMLFVFDFGEYSR